MNLGLEADRAAVDFCESAARQPATLQQLLFWSLLIKWRDSFDKFFNKIIETCMWYSFPNSLAYKFWFCVFKKSFRLVYCLLNQKHGHSDGTFEYVFYPLSLPLPFSGRSDMVSYKEWTEMTTFSFLNTYNQYRF